MDSFTWPISGPRCCRWAFWCWASAYSGSPPSTGAPKTENTNMIARMNTLPDRVGFENIYASPAPWDIGKPQAPFVAVADRAVSPVLDAGCGTGENALFLAA